MDENELKMWEFKFFTYTHTLYVETETKCTVSIKVNINSMCKSDNSGANNKIWHNCMCTMQDIHHDVSYTNI